MSKELFCVFVGGGGGAVGRYLVSLATLSAAPHIRFPLGTLSVNLIGCFLIGLIAAVLVNANAQQDTMRLLLVTGFLGGFTTFSAFGFEALHLMRNETLLLAGLYIFLSLFGSLLMVGIGGFVGKSIG